MIQLPPDASLIEGTWVHAAQALTVRNPDNDDLLGSVTLHEAETMESAIDAAVRAFPSWSTRTAEDRADILPCFQLFVLGHQDGQRHAVRPAAYLNPTVPFPRVALVRGIEAGMVGTSTGLISTAVASFGCATSSGLGREGSRHGLDDSRIQDHLPWLLISHERLSYAA